MLACRIEKHGNAFLINANGKLLPMYAYMTYQPSKGRYRDFGACGVKLYSVAVYAGDRGINPSTGIRPFRPGFMQEDGSYDFSYADEDFRLAAGGAKPGEAYIIPRLMLEMPSWWEKQHPGALCRDQAGVPCHCSHSSDEWIKACTDAMQAFEDWLESSGWNDYIAGWHIAGGATEEYIRPVIHPLQFFDYSECSLEHYRRRLREKYISIDRLNAAWGESLADFDEVQVPSPAARVNHQRDDAQLYDWYEFYSDETALLIKRLCAEGKRITGGRKLMGVFYGNISLYATELSHNSLDLLLEDPNADFFASPFTYPGSRAQDTDWPFQATIESALLHGKPWFVEADVRTHLSRPISEAMSFADPEVNRAYDASIWFGPDSPDISVGDMLRAFGKILTHNGAMWWFDMWGGWYDDEKLMEFQKAAARLYAETALSGGLERHAQLAVFLDEKGFNRYPSDGRLAEQLDYRQFVQLGNIGAPYDSFLLSDFEKVDPAGYRAALIISPCGDSSRFDAWKRGGRTLIFSGAEVSSPAEGERELAGSVYMRSYREYSTVRSALDLLPPEIIRDILLISGAKVYNFSGDNVYAAGSYIALHAVSDGVKRLYYPSIGKAYDVQTGKRMPGTDLWCEREMRTGETMLIRFED